MRRLINVLGLLGVLFVVTEFVAVMLWRPSFIVNPFALSATLFLAVFVLSLPVVALVALAYGDSRPKLSAALYFVAAVVGFPLLLIVGIMAATEPPSLCLLFPLPLLTWLAAGVLTVTNYRAQSA